VVAASKNPNAVDTEECTVPYKVNDKWIFFGPCKKHLRENFYRLYLSTLHDGEVDVSSEDLYVVGVNGSNVEKIRKIVWAGKVQRTLTFEKAYNTLSSDEQFKEMVMRKNSPLHLEPIYNETKTFIGYKLRSTEHEENNEWIFDVMKEKNADVRIKGKMLILKDPSRRKEVFSRDCCFLCENIFFAEGKGIDIGDDILRIFKKAQPDKTDIDKYAIFGRTKNGSANGLRGNYLEICEPLANKLVKAIIRRSEKMAIHNKPLKKNIQRRGKCS